MNLNVYKNINNLLTQLESSRRFFIFSYKDKLRTNYLNAKFFMLDQEMRFFLKRFKQIIQLNLP